MVQVTAQIYLGNAFSLSMLPMTEEVTVKFRKVGVEEVRALLSNGFVSAIGHPSTASALSKILGVNVPTNRVSIQLQPGDTLIIFQLSVGRLAPGQELTEQDILSAFSQGKAYFVRVSLQ
ncbi:MAG: DUF1874 domain-containing protein [Caldivirga sp.]